MLPQTPPHCICLILPLEGSDAVTLGFQQGGWAEAHCVCRLPGDGMSPKCHKDSRDITCSGCMMVGEGYLRWRTVATRRVLH
jgi:hypothetical protein